MLRNRVWCARRDLSAPSTPTVVSHDDLRLGYNSEPGRYPLSPFATRLLVTTNPNPN
jgi:hypothetical protein